MRNGFLRLWHHTIIRRDDEDHNIRSLRTTRAHLCECGMARSIEKSDLASLHLNLIRANMLGNTASFTRRHIRLADGIEQAGLSMIHMEIGRASCRERVCIA